MSALCTLAVLALVLLPSAAHAQTTYTYKGTSGNFSDGFDKPLTLTNGSYGANDATFLFGGTSAYTAINNLTSALVLNVLSFTNTKNVMIARGTNAKNQLIFNATNGSNGGTTPTIVLGNGASASLLVDQDMVFNANTAVSGSGSATFAGVLSGSGAFLQNGTGTLTLTGLGSSLTGSAFFNSGTTRITGATAATSASLTVNGTTIGGNSGSAVTVTVSGVSSGGVASLLSASSNLDVGNSGTGTLNVLDGGQVTTYAVGIGNGSGSNGTVTVSGVNYTTVSGVNKTTASSLSISNLDVGLNGMGALNVLDGGQVTVAAAGLYRNILIGGNYGSTGTVTVSGVNNTTASSLSTGGSMVVGEQGMGVLNVLDGGQVTAAGVISIGANPTGTGTVTVSGVNYTTVSGVNKTTASSLSTGGNLVVGGNGMGAFNILDGGQVSAAGVIFIGNYSVGKGNGTVTVSGVNNTTASSLSTTGGSLYIGLAGMGSLNITNGGVVTTGSGTTYLSDQSGSTSSLIINGGSLTTNALLIGADNNGVGVVSAFKLTNPTAANGGGYALNIGGSGNSSSAIGVAITDASAGDGASGSIAGGLGGAGGIDKTGSGALTLNAANTFSGGMKIDGGSVILGNQNALQNSTAFLNVNNGLNLNNLAQVNLGGLAGGGSLALGNTVLTVGGNNASTTYSGILSGSGSLTKTGSGDLALSGNNTFTGRTRIQAGTLTVGSANALQNSTVSLQVDNGLNLNGMSSVTLGGLAGTGSLNRGSTNLSVGNNNADTAYSGVMSGAGSLTKTGTGALTLTGASTASGMTTITQGTVVASGTGLGTGRVTVGSAGTLGVGEALNTSRTAQSVNTLTILSLTLAPNSSAALPQLTFNLGTSGTSDQLVLTGAGNNVFQLSSSGTFFLGFASATGANLTAGTYTLMSFTNQSNTQSLPALTAFQATASGNLASLSTPANAFSYDTSSGHVVLRFTITGAGVPEPSAIALLAMGLLGVVAMVGGPNVRNVQRVQWIRQRKQNA